MLTSSSTEADLLAFHAVRDAGFDERRPAGPGEIAQMRRQLDHGTLFALGRLDGVAAGTAVLTPLDRVGEITGVSTLPAFRRRGVAATVTSRLVDYFFVAGGTLAWLDAADIAARALYSGLGFRVVANWLSYIQP